VGTLLNRILKRTKTIAGKVDEAQEAITFAQAGHPQLDGEPESSAPTISGKLLVAGHETMFSQRVIDYALDMAKRMGYEIVALNAAPLSCNAFKPFAASQKKLCDEFQQMSVEHVQSFKQEAEKMGIPFTHVVKFSEPEKALEMIQQEYSPIDFVITDEQPATLENRATEEQRPNRQVYVYSMI
jgi:nucleotide-binding universal stress UspA family protein